MRTKEEKAIYNKKYREENKESIKAKAKNYREKNKKRIKANRDANKERAKLYREANKDKMSAYQKRRNDSIKDGLFIVYYLKEENYVGQTCHLPARLGRHKHRYNRHILDVEVLAKFETREEALAFEAKLHDMGYNGRNNGL